MWLKSLTKTVQTLFTAYYFKLIILSSLLSLIAFLGIGFGIYYGITHYISSSIAWLQYIIDFTSGAGAALIAWFMLPAILPFIASFFQDIAAEKIEQNSYIGIPKPKHLPILPELFQDIQFLIWMLFLNILCLPLYLIPMLNIGVYYLLNAYLLGREFFEIVVGRHIGKAKAKKLRRQHRWTSIIAGAFILLVANTPGLNLLAPLIAVALMVHVVFQKNIPIAP